MHANSDVLSGKQPLDRRHKLISCKNFHHNMVVKNVARGCYIRCLRHEELFGVSHTIRGIPASSTPTVTANRTNKAEDQVKEYVRLSRELTKINSAPKKHLDEWLHQERTGTTTLAAVAPKSFKGSTLARKSAVQVRKYPRHHDSDVGSIIE
jgi:hypothetical protein